MSYYIDHASQTVMLAGNVDPANYRLVSDIGDNVFYLQISPNAKAGSLRGLYKIKGTSTMQLRNAIKKQRRPARRQLLASHGRRLDDVYVNLCMYKRGMYDAPELTGSRSAIRLTGRYEHQPITTTYIRSYDPKRGVFTTSSGSVYHIGSVATSRDKYGTVSTGDERLFSTERQPIFVKRIEIHSTHGISFTQPGGLIASSFYDVLGMSEAAPPSLQNVVNAGNVPEEGAR